MERKTVRRSLLKPSGSFTVRFYDEKKHASSPIDFWDRLAIHCQNTADRLNFSAVISILIGAPTLVLIVLVVLFTARHDPSIARHVLNASLTFQNAEYDFYLHKSPVTFSEAIKILNDFNGSRLLDYKVIHPDVVTQLENSLSTDVIINSNEPLNATELLLGTHLIWTGAFFDWSSSKSLEIHHYNDAAITKLAEFPGINKGKCHSGEHYERYMNSKRVKSMGGPLYFRIAIQISCRGMRKGADVLTRRCSDTCATMVADDASSPRHLVAFSKRKELPNIDVSKVLLKVRSADNLWDFVFHDVKVTREGLERIVQNLGGEKLSVSLFDDENFYKISGAFKILEISGIENKKLLFWTSGFFDFTDANPRLLKWGDGSTSEIEAFEHWCNHRDYIGDEPGVALERHLLSFQFSEITKADDHLHYVLFRVRDFYHESFRHDPPCLSMDDNNSKTGEAMFHLAYRLPVIR